MDAYRPNVAALILNPAGKLLICERDKTPNAWQFPQGGVDDGETARGALYREVSEEVGYTRSDYALVGDPRSGYRYDYPPGILQKKLLKHSRAHRHYVGQEQTYFLCQLHEFKDPDIDQKPREFGAYRWIEPSEFRLEWLPDFKKDVYRAVFRDFFNIDLGPS